jgi:parallel beta-helix repeat protein
MPFRRANLSRRLNVEVLESREVPSTMSASSLPQPAEVSAQGLLPRHVLEVHQGVPTAKYQTIQSAVNAAQAGDEILVFSGTYKEAVTVNKNNITIEGAPGANVKIENPSSAENGITVEGANQTTISGFKLANVTVDGFKENGVYLIGVSNFSLSHITAKNNGDYGLDVALGANGVIAGSSVSGNNDSGIYVGQSHDVSVHDNKATNNVNGIEIENSSHVTAAWNIVGHNTVGILVDLLPAAVVAVPGHAPVTTSADNVIENNVVYANNRANTASPDDLASVERPGTGIAIIGGDHTLVQRNTIFANAYTGIILLSGNDLLALAPGTPGYTAGVDPNPNHTLIRQNLLFSNGFVPAPSGFPASADLIWTGTGTDNHWRNNHYKTSTPSHLP